MEEKEKEKEKKKKENEKEKEKEIKVNYLNVLDKDSKNVYILKVFVKPGHPKHLYHLVTTDGKNLDFFVRNDRNVEKLQFPVVHEMITSKLKIFEKAIDDEGERIKLKPELFHPSCRFEVET